MRTCPCNSQCATSRLPFSRPLASVWRAECSTRLVCHHAPLGRHNIAGSNPGPHLRAFTRLQVTDQGDRTTQRLSRILVLRKVPRAALISGRQLCLACRDPGTGRCRSGVCGAGFTHARPRGSPEGLRAGCCERRTYGSNARRTANPCSRSTMRSLTSSSPIWNRTSGPSKRVELAVRVTKPLVGRARLS